MKGPTFRVFLASLIVFSLAAILLAGRLDPAGDEPHYLLATYSLLADHDLDMANNYAAKDYERFFHTERYPPGALDDIATWKHAFDYKGDGRLYSVHNVGLSALLVPAYALGGRPGTALFMGLLAALLVTQVYAVCRSHTSRQMTTLLSWLPLVFSIPLMPFASTVYPEVPAALIVISAWRLVFEKDNPRPGHFLAVALLAALLPWFHVKYLAASAAILVICLVRWRKEILRAESLLSATAPVAVSGLLLGVFFYHLYGSPSPFAPYAAPVVGMHLETMGDGLLGLWLDQEFGLLAYSPVYIFAIFGLVRLALDRKYGLVLALAVVFGSVYLPSAAYGAWWGGLSFPSRFLLPVLPLLSVPTSYLIGKPREHHVKIGFLVIGALSVAIATVGLFNPSLFLGDEGGVSKFWTEIGQGRVRLERVLPSFIRYRAVWQAESLPRIVGEDVDDAYASDKRARFSGAGSPQGFLGYGPYINLKEGQYKVTFYMKSAAASSNNPVATIDVSITSASGETTLLAQRDLSAEAFSSFPHYQDFSLNFATPGNLPIEFRVKSLGKAALWVDAIQVWQVR